MNASTSSDQEPSKYDHKEVEVKWQKQWATDGTYNTQDNSDKPKQYILDMFPYPSGEGLHVGHPRGYIATDVYSRKKRMEGFNVLHPMGWDAFGLPAENFAIKNKVHPRIAVEQNVARFKEQLSKIGLDYDWSREVNTTDPAFYKWTQWTFLQMLKKGLAYESNEPVNWCPTDKTVLANEDVEPDGTCERCGTLVEKRPMRQWVLKITDYADRLLADLDHLPKWPEGVKEAQRNWIGKNEGSEIDFPVVRKDLTTTSEHSSHMSDIWEIKVFTTRADTLFGVTYIGVSAGLAKKWMGMGWKPSTEVETYIEETLKIEAVKDFKEKEKTGIYAGFDAINPATKESIPVWITNYVMSDVGTGAIMGVPAHDERDFAFAKKYNLKIKTVVVGEYNPVTRVTALLVTKNKDLVLQSWNIEDNKKLLGRFGGHVESGENIFETLKRELKEEVELDIDQHSYYFADYLDTHIDEGDIVFVVENVDTTKLVQHEGDEIIELNKYLPKTEGLSENSLNAWKKYTSNLYTADERKGTLVNSNQFSGLISEEAKIKITEFVGGKIVSTYRIKDWVFSRQRYWGEPIPVIHCNKCGVVAVPEDQLPVLLPEVSQYEPTGTGESPLAAIENWVNTTCPACGGAAKRETNTMPQWAGSSWYYLRYVDPLNNQTLIDPTKERSWMPVDVYVGGDHATRHLIYARFWHKFLFDIGVVSTEEPFPRLEFLGFILAEDGRKMSKRWKNVVNPDDVINTFGADAFRLYEMFIGPFEGTVPWSTNGLVGTYRFVEKVWSIGTKEFLPETNLQIKTLIQKTIIKVSEDIEHFKFNTAISTLMILVNEIQKNGIAKKDFKTVLQLLAPFAPHMTEELWYELGDSSTDSGQETKSIHLGPWPVADESLLTDETVTIGVQINGKVRAELTIAKDASKEEIEMAARALPRVVEYIQQKEITSVIVVPGRIINILLG